MHLRVRPLQVLIKLLFLVVAQELADLFVGFIAVRPHLVQALFTRQTFVLHDLLRGIMQFLEDWCDSGLLIAGEINLLSQLSPVRSGASRDWFVMHLVVCIACWLFCFSLV